MQTTRSLGAGAVLWRAMLISLLILLAACDLSASPSASTIGSPTDDACGPEDVARGGIDGLVVDPDGNPVNDVLIQIRSTGGFRGTTRTGDDGTFTAPGVAGEFQVTTTDIAYDPLVREFVVPCGELFEVELELTPADS